MSHLQAVMIIKECNVYSECITCVYVMVALVTQCLAHLGYSAKSLLSKWGWKNHPYLSTKDYYSENVLFVP